MTGYDISPHDIPLIGDVIKMVETIIGTSFKTFNVIPDEEKKYAVGTFLFVVGTLILIRTIYVKRGAIRNIFRKIRIKWQPYVVLFNYSGKDHVDKFAKIHLKVKRIERRVRMKIPFALRLSLIDRIKLISCIPLNLMPRESQNNIFAVFVPTEQYQVKTIYDIADIVASTYFEPVFWGCRMGAFAFYNKRVGICSAEHGLIIVKDVWDNLKFCVMYNERLRETSTNLPVSLLQAYPSYKLVLVHSHAPVFATSAPSFGDIKSFSDFVRLFGNRVEADCIYSAGELTVMSANTKMGGKIYVTTPSRKVLKLAFFDRHMKTPLDESTKLIQNVLNSVESSK